MTQQRRLRLLAVAGPALLAAGSIFASASTALASTPTVQSDGDALFTTEGGVTLQALASARTIPHFTFQYTDPTNGVTYPITMVGADPRTNQSTTVHTEIIPLKMNFVAANQDMSVLNDNGYPGFRATALNWTSDGHSKVAATLASPAFTDAMYPADLGGDTAQLGDAFLRAQFHKIGSSYHVKLLNDAVLPTVTINVPSNQGIAFVRPVPAWRVANHIPGATADVTGLANISWFSAELQNLMKSMQIDPTTLPIFVTDNVLLYIGEGNYTNCCVLGYHGAASAMPNSHGTGSVNGQGANRVQTYMYAAYTTPGTYSGYETDYTGARTQPRAWRGLADIHALSHEVSEWMDDPFTNNAVQPWKTPTAPQYGCTRLLEVGDPVVGVWFGLPHNTFTSDPNSQGMWHPEDEVFAQWYGRGGIEPVLGPSWDGRLTFMGPRTTSIMRPGVSYAGFGTYATGC